MVIEKDAIMPLYPSPHSTSLFSELQRLLRKRSAKIFVILFFAFAIFRTLKNTIPPSQPPHYGIPSSWPGTSSETNRDTLWSGNDSMTTQAQVGKVHALFGEENPTYERALRLHELHSQRMGHPMFVLREKLLSGLWSKPAYILSILLEELARPEDERLKWLLWNDADIVIMNPNIPLDIFIPPKPEFDYVNMLVTNDRHGLNNGVFLIRVNDWAVKLFSCIIAFHTFKPEVKLQYSEQSAMEEMIEDGYWRRAVVHIPQYWLNGYPVYKEVVTPKPHEFRPGGLQIHFAGNRDGKRPERMNAMMDIAEQGIAPWEVPLEETWYQEHVKSFWDDLSARRLAKGIKPAVDNTAAAAAATTPTTEGEELETAEIGSTASQEDESQKMR